MSTLQKGVLWTKMWEPTTESSPPTIRWRTAPSIPHLQLPAELAILKNQRRQVAKLGFVRCFNVEPVDISGRHLSFQSLKSIGWKFCFKKSSPAFWLKVKIWPNQDLSRWPQLPHQSHNHWQRHEGNQGGRSRCRGSGLRPSQRCWRLCQSETRWWEAQKSSPASWASLCGN